MKYPQISKPKANGEKGEKGKWKGTKTPWGDRTEEKKNPPPLAKEWTVYDYDSGNIR